jgi:hypothetical protein
VPTRLGLGAPSAKPMYDWRSKSKCVDSSNEKCAKKFVANRCVLSAMNAKTALTECRGAINYENNDMKVCENNLEC